jgi:HD-GYP domain-containing protein (c-di-GMP phosphodiesterase class II)
MELAREIMDPDSGRILLGVGCTKLARFSERLKKAGIEYLYVEDPVSKGIVIPKMLREELRASLENALKSVYVKFQQNEKPDFTGINNCIKDIVAEILRNKEISVNVFELRVAGGGMFGHAVNVTVLSIILGKNLYFDEDKLRKLGLGAILHDIGMARLPQTGILGKRPLTEHEKLLFQQHPLIGYHMIKDSWDVTASSKGIVLSHHERSDGTGYPRCILKGEIHEFSRIVGLVDLFDELSGGHPSSLKWPVQDTVEYLTLQSEAFFDAELVKLFVSRTPLFPTGSTLQLTDGRKAVVCSQNDGFPSRPCVRIIHSGYGTTEGNIVEIDLLHNNHIAIDKVE